MKPIVILSEAKNLRLEELRLPEILSGHTGGMCESDTEICGGMGGSGDGDGLLRSTKLGVDACYEFQWRAGQCEAA